VGGSNRLGALGYVDAARELAAQVRAGQLPEPDLVVVALGSGGTVAGLAAGLALEGISARVLGVAVAEPPWVIEHVARSLAGSCLKELAAEREARRPETHIEFDRRYLGRGYAHATPEGERALEAAARSGLTLDLTYTAKAFAAALDRVEARSAKTILFWNTLSGAPLGPLLEGAPEEASLDEELRRLLR
jgi:D-cysteine desulfhydrase